MTSTLPPLIQAFSGAVGSASANVLTYPLDLVTTHVQLEPLNSSKPKGILRAISIIQSIIRRKGISALYRGVWTDTGATIISNFLYFYFYSFLRFLSTKRFSALHKSRKSFPKLLHKPTVLEELVLGFVAGVASRAVSTPLSIITLRLQSEGGKHHDEDTNKLESRNISGVMDIVNHIYDEQGLAGFWRGFQTTTLLSLNPSLTLALFQLFRRFLLFLNSPVQASSSSTAVKQAMSNRNTATLPDPTPNEAFFGAAISNSVAVTLLYPIILAKTRLQATSATSMKQVLTEAYNARNTSVNSWQDKLGPNLGTKIGIRGLYQGVEMQILKGFLNQGVTFLVKGRIEQMIVNIYLRRKRS